MNEIENPGEETAMILDSIISSVNNNDSDAMFERTKEILLCINQKGFMFSASLADGVTSTDAMEREEPLTQVGGAGEF